MALPIRRFILGAARRVASDPRARETAMKTGRGLAREAGTIVGNESPARAAGRSFRRALDRLTGEAGQNEDTQPGPPDRKS